MAIYVCIIVYTLHLQVVKLLMYLRSYIVAMWVYDMCCILVKLHIKHSDFKIKEATV